MIVGNGELDAGKAAPLERQQEVAPTRPLSRLARSTPRICRRPPEPVEGAIDRHRDQHRRLTMIPDSRTFS
jgi:hypothetical protein